MKILTGDLKGRVIHLWPGENLRPTSDIVRKAIFDTLQGVLQDKRVLDLFAGTGALGFEALSGGAREVIWVESDRAQVAAIEKTVSGLKLQAPGRVISSDVFKAIEMLARKEEMFDLLFLDPPYHQGLGQRALKLAAERGLLAPGALAVLETHKTEDPAELLAGLKSIKTKKHGDTKITFYRAD